MQVSAIEQGQDMEEEVQPSVSYGRNYEEVIERYPVSRPEEVASDFNFIRDVHNHIILGNNRAENVTNR